MSTDCDIKKKLIRRASASIDITPQELKSK